MKDWESRFGVVGIKRIFRIKKEEVEKVVFIFIR